MKTKIMILLLYFLFGIWQNTIGQEMPDSLLLQKAKDTTLIIGGVDTLLVDNDKNILFQLDSLRTMYQEKESELKILGKVIDSLEILVKLSDNVISYQDSSSLYQDSSTVLVSKDLSPVFDDEDEDWIKLYGFLFKIENCRPFNDSLYITARVKYLEGANIVFRVSIEGFETFRQQDALKERTSGSKTEVIYSSVVSNDQIFRLRVPLKKENLGKNVGIIKVKIIMRFTNSSPIKYQKYIEKMYEPIKNNWKNKHYITL